MWDREISIDQPVARLERFDRVFTDRCAGVRDRGQVARRCEHRIEPDAELRGEVKADVLHIRQPDGIDCVLDLTLVNQVGHCKGVG